MTPIEPTGTDRSKPSIERVATSRGVAALVSWLGSLAAGGGPLTPNDRARWAAATTLAELGELTALWLEGHIESHPGYWGPADVDEAIAPGLSAALGALNRAGYVTTSSQAGAADRDRGWELGAYVTGFAAPATSDWLAGLLAGTRFKLIACPTRPWWRRPHPPVEIGRHAGDPYHLEVQLSRSTIADLIFGGCSHAAITAVCDAAQVTIVDPEPARNDLWPHLHHQPTSRPVSAAGG